MALFVQVAGCKPMVFSGNDVEFLEDGNGEIVVTSGTKERVWGVFQKKNLAGWWFVDDSTEQSGDEPASSIRVTVSGIRGAGATTVAAAIYRAMNDAGFHVRIDAALREIERRVIKQTGIAKEVDDRPIVLTTISTERKNPHP